MIFPAAAFTDEGKASPKALLNVHLHKISDTFSCEPYQRKQTGRKVCLVGTLRALFVLRALDYWQLMLVFKALAALISACPCATLSSPPIKLLT